MLKNWNISLDLLQIYEFQIFYFIYFGSSDGWEQKWTFNRFILCVDANFVKIITSKKNSCQFVAEHAVLFLKDR